MYTYLNLLFAWHTNLQINCNLLLKLALMYFPILFLIYNLYLLKKNDRNDHFATAQEEYKFSIIQKIWREIISNYFQAAR